MNRQAKRYAKYHPHQTFYFGINNRIKDGGMMMQAMGGKAFANKNWDVINADTDLMFQLIDLQEQKKVKK